MWEIHDYDPKCPSSVAGWFDWQTREESVAIGFALDWEYDVIWVTHYSLIHEEGCCDTTIDSQFEDIPLTAMVQGF